MAEIDPSYQLLACQYLRKQLDALTKEMRGVRENQDIEPVHQARVASRRMRAALGMFSDCFDAKKIGQWQKRVKRLTKGLGTARDMDVQIEFIESFASRLDPKDRKYKPGVERLLLRLRQQREAVQPEVIKTLEAVTKGNTLAEMYGQLETVRFMLRTGDVSIQSPFVFQQTAAHIRRRRRDLLVFEHAMADPQDSLGHHQFRITAKKLRYTMEICSPVYDGQLGPTIKAVKKIQSCLGDIHDCDVWVDNIQAFMEQERQQTIDYFGHHGPFNRLKPGLLRLCEDRMTCRQEAFQSLVAYWDKLNETHLWDDLETILRSHVEPEPNEPIVTEPPTTIEPDSIVPSDTLINEPEEKTNDDSADQ